MFHKKRSLPSLQKRILILNLVTAVVLFFACTSILFLLVYNVLSGYVQNDLAFVLRQTLSNMEDKTLLVEDTYLRLCADRELHTILLSDTGIGGMQKETKKILQSQSGLYLERNTSNLSLPFLDMVYLFDRNDQFMSCSYITYNANIQQTWNREYETIYHRFLKTNEESQIIRSRNHINIIRKLYSSNQEYIGTVIFGINENMFIEMASPFSSYPGSFWMIFDDMNDRILASRGNALERTDVEAITLRSGQSAITYRAGYTDYLVCSLSFRMGLGGIVGIPENYFTSLLFGSVKSYLLTMGGAILLFGLIMIIVYARVFRPLSDMAAKIQLVSRGDLNTRLPAYPLWEYNTISIACNAMLDHIEHLINDVYEKKILIMDNEMKYLQAQMDPHFMYNVLNTIALNAKIDGNEEIYRMTTNFMGLTQARLSHGGNPFVSLEQEMQYVKFYLEIQKSRFGDKIQYSIEIPQELYQAKIPKLALEMLVENSVTHGIEPKYGSGHVSVCAEIKDNELLITVKDDGVGFKGIEGTVPLPLQRHNLKPGHNRIAINNTYLLIKHYYGDAYGLHIESYQGKGTTVHMHLPFEVWKEGSNYV